MKIMIVGQLGQLTEVEAQPTCSRYFVLTPDLVATSMWNITHLKSTSKVEGPFDDLDAARKIAAIFAQIPLPWDEISVTTVQDHRVKSWKKFEAAWASTNVVWKEWKNVVHASCMERMRTFLAELETP